MPAKVEYGASAIVSLDGKALSRPVADVLMDVVVHNHSHLPDMVELRFRDNDVGMLRTLGVKYASAIEVKATSVGDQPATPIFTGEVTSIESEYDAGIGTRLVIRGYDKAHRLTRGRKSRAYVQLSFSDIARKVVEEAGLRRPEVDAAEVRYEHIVQLNESDWDFLQRLARENDFEVVSEQGAVIVRRVHPAASAPAPGQVRRPSPDPLALVLGTNLHSLQIRASSAAQVRDVVVRGWDWKAKGDLVGKASVETSSIRGSVVPAALATPFGAHTVVHFDQPLESFAHATAEARSIAERIAASSVEIFGTMMGTPKLKAGVAISVAGAGDHFDGKYVVTSSRHVFAEDGYRTEFEISGRMNRSLSALAGGDGGGPSEHGRMSGVVVGLVTNTKDPEPFGRVKLKFPWLSAEIESTWARVATVDAGPGGRGTSFTPEVNDEVLVAFEHGDFRRPYVIGSLWNGRDTAPRNVVNGTGQVVERGYKSSTGHRLIFDDDPAKGSVEIVTSKGNRILIDDRNQKLTIKIGASSLEMETGGNITLKGINIKVEADAALELKGTTVKVEGIGQTEIKGGIVKIN